MRITDTSSYLREQLERIWIDNECRSPTHYLIWTGHTGVPDWKQGRLASLRKSKPKRKVSRRQSQET
jgi:hypothetical protein